MLTDEFPAPSIFSLAYLSFVIVVVTLTFTFNLVAVIYVPRIGQDNLKKTSSKYQLHDFFQSNIPLNLHLL